MVALNLAYVILVILWIKETERKKRKRLLFISGGIIPSTSTFIVSLIVDSTGLRAIFTLITIVSISIVSAFSAAYVISEYRYKRKKLY
jgi:hypothetical protein